MKSSRDKILDLVVKKEFGELEDKIGFSSNIFMVFGLPVRRYPDRIFEKKTQLCSLKVMNPNYEVPYGCYARMNQIFIDTEVKTKSTNIIDVGRSFRDYVNKLGYADGKANKALIRQLVNYVTSVISVIPKESNKWRFLGIQTSVAKKWDISFDVKNPDQLMLAKGQIFLDEDYAKYIYKHSVPLDMHVINCFNRNPLALDFYRFLAYRNNGLHKPIAFPDHLLFEQLGTEQHENKITRTRLMHILKAIQMFWPVQAKFEDGYFEMSPSPPAVQHKIPSRRPITIESKSVDK